jgi:3-oxoacyl-[acyl-carrier-protein] synthase-3
MSTVGRSRILGVGSYLPKQKIHNAELAQRLDTSDAWIVERTGIKVRHIADTAEKTSDLATKAALAAIAHADIKPQDIDLVIVATATPDETFPATACRVQANLGIHQGAAFDLQAVCSGFIYALTTADNFLRAGSARTALVIGAETFSRILDWQDRTTAVLFGDGAGAVILQSQQQPNIPGSENNDIHPGILATRLHADGRYHDLLYVDGGPSSTGTVGHLRMQGKEVFRHAVTNLAQVMRDTLAQAKLEPEQINWIVPHQANRRILEATAQKLGLDPSRVIVTVDRHANTSAASVPLALDVAVRDGRIKPGDVLLLEAMGGGFTWGAALVRWG